MAIHKFRQPMFNSKKEFTGWHYWGILDSGYVSPWLSANKEQDTSILSQKWTGKLDKEGKEIYCGDRVLHYTNGHLEEPDEHTETVYWDDDALTYLPLGGDMGCGDNCLVLGNDYDGGFFQPPLSEKIRL